jgi:hypothetical protein
VGRREKCLEGLHGFVVRAGLGVEATHVRAIG